MTTAPADVPLAAVATALYLYPVKACAGVAVEALEIDERGAAAGDRHWAIVDGDGVLTWLGSHPRLALVTPRFLAAGGPGRGASGASGTPGAAGASGADAGLLLSAPGVAPVATPPVAALSGREVRIWNERTCVHEVFPAADAGDAVAAWLAQVTGAPLRLVRLGDAAIAREGPSALHLVFADSMAAVDAELAAQGHARADPRRYRPNVVLAGAGAPLDPFLEDTLEAITWTGQGAPTRLAVTSLCIRCVVPNVDPATAAVSEALLHTLATLAARRRPGAPTSFGIYARGEPGTRLALHDTAGLTIAF
jgi:uncharacterized protein YcbX